MIMAGSKRILAIIICGLAIATPLLARAPQRNLQTIEEEQQFLYYFYEAQRLIHCNEIEQAKPIVEFCYLLNPDDATINNDMGYYAKDDGEDEKAIGFFQRAFQLNPDEYWYNYNVLLLQTENKKEQKTAIANLEKITKTNKTNAELYDLLQKAYVNTQQYRKALLLQDQIDTITGYNAMSAMQRYRINVMMKNNKQAIYEIDRYLAIDPNDYQFQVFRLQLYEQTHQPPHKMIPAYEAVFKIDPRNTMIMNNLAWNMALLRKDLLRAEQLSRTTIMREPTNPIYLDTYGWIMYLLGDCDSALFYIERAIQNSNGQADQEIKSHYREIKRKCK